MDERADSGFDWDGAGSGSDGVEVGSAEAAAAAAAAGTVVAAFGGPLQACQGGASIQYCPQIQAPRTCSSSSEHPYPKRDEAPWRADRMLGSLPEGLHDAQKTPRGIDCHGAKGVQAHAGKREIGTSVHDELVPSVDTERAHRTECEWMMKHLVLVFLGAGGQWAYHNGLSPTCVP